MTQPILLRINAQALEALFPEGSQARVDIQASVIDEFTRKYIKPSSMPESVVAKLSETRMDFERRIDNEVKEALKKEGLYDLILSRTRIPPSVASKIHEQALQAVTDLITSSVRAQLEQAVVAATEKLASEIESRMAKTLAIEVERRVSEAVNSRISILSSLANQ
jgi:hypothetical protein